ncbi:hypothetical protein [Streptomyces sp. N35]|uniref:hypothetical protein n=1 Tax=Streptomyces sp. N35 TaxID=2795730 RepID=UPI0018F7A037|nr:hypothetical protein [Streptomyces sp. N35]
MSTLSFAPRGLTWAFFRLHRASLLFFGGCFLAFVGFEIYTYRVGIDPEQTGNVCGPLDPSCHLSLGIYSRDYYNLLLVSEAVLAYLPLVLAAYIGGAVIARELESGTAALAWTQSVTPVRWLAAKLAWPALLTTLGMTVLLLLHWWVRTETGPAGREWYGADTFRATGPVGLAWVLCALAVGAFCGLVLKRTLPALGAAVAVMVAANWLTNVHRWKLWPSVSRYESEYSSVGSTSLQLENRSWDAAGREVPWMGEGWGSAVRHYREFQPRSHFWPIQWVESGLALALAGALTLACFWLLRRRTP